METNKKLRLYLITGLLLLFIGSIFIIYQSQYHWDILISRGPIGDFLAGTIGPLINLLGILLVFLSFQEQVKANNIQYRSLKDSLEMQLKTHNFTSLEKSLESIIQEFDSKFKENHRFDSSTRSFEENIRYFHFHDPLRNFILMCAQYGYLLLQSDLMDKDKCILYNRYTVFTRGLPQIYIKTLGQYFLKNRHFDLNIKQHKDIQTIISNYAVIVSEVTTKFKETIVSSGNQKLMQEILKKYDINSVNKFLEDEVY